MISHEDQAYRHGDSAEKEVESRSEFLRILLYELNSAIAPRQARLEAIHAVLREFDHNNKQWHDDELDVQADRILFQKIAFAHAVFKASSVANVPAAFEEIELVAGALEMVYRASPSRVAVSFSEVGVHMIPLLIGMIHKPHYERSSDILQSISKPPDPSPTHVLETSETKIESEHEMNAREEENSKQDQHLDKDATTTAPLASAPDSPLDITDLECVCDEDEFNDGSEGAFLHGSTDSGPFPRQPAAVTDSATHANDANVIVLDRPSRDQGAYSADPNEDLYMGWRHIREDDDANLPEDKTFQKTPSSITRRVKFLGDKEVDYVRGVGRSKAVASPNRVSDLVRDGTVSDGAISCIVKVLRHYSRILSVMAPLAQQVGLVDALVFQMGRRRSLNPSDWASNSERREDRLLAEICIDSASTLVNLACCEENKCMMFTHAFLMDEVLRSADVNESQEIKELSTGILMNLSYGDSNKVLMGYDDLILETLCMLTRDKSRFTQRCATVTLNSLSFVSANVPQMIDFQRGLIISSLSRVLLEDTASESRLHAAEACFNLVNFSDGNLQLVDTLGCHIGFLPTLAHAVFAGDNRDVQNFAARALEQLSGHICADMACHEILLRALTKSALWTKSKYIAQALLTQSLDGRNRAAIIEHDGLLDALASLALIEDADDEVIRNAAVCTLIELSKEDTVRCTVARNEGVMTALMHASFASRKGIEKKGSQDASVVKDVLRILSSAIQ